jgi:uncharacterized protein
MRLIAIGAGALTLFVLAGLNGVGLPEAASGAEGDATRSISATGVGSVSVTPDEAELSFGVQTQGSTATAALEANATAMRRVLAALRNAGIADDDLQTQYLSVSPRTEPDGTAIVGYDAFNSVSARIGNLARVGPVIDAATAAGANTVSGPSFGRSDREELHQQALRAAYENARANAQALAAAANVTLGNVVSVVEGVAAAPMPLAMERSAVATDVPVEPGKQEIQATVTVTFAIP